ncbi:MAG: hypothetical protein JWM20_759 [Patescibacteria group bacterium]|nr:hypothetical protein [Patescibacteria group bacterium]
MKSRFFTWSFGDTLFLTILFAILLIAGFGGIALPLVVCGVIAFGGCFKYFYKSPTLLDLAVFGRILLVALMLSGIFHVCLYSTIGKLPERFTLAQYYGIYVGGGMICYAIPCALFLIRKLAKGLFQQPKEANA